MSRSIPLDAALVTYDFITLTPNLNTQVLAANPKRIWCEVHSRSTNANGANAQIRYGEDLAQSLTHGQILLAGDTVRLEVQNAINCFSNAVGQVVVVSEIVRA